MADSGEESKTEADISVAAGRRENGEVISPAAFTPPETHAGTGEETLSLPRSRGTETGPESRETETRVRMEMETDTGSVLSKESNGDSNLLEEDKFSKPIASASSDNQQYQAGGEKISIFTDGLEF